MAKGFSFGKIQLRDDDTIFSISYNGTIRFIINKTSGDITFGAVDGTGATGLNTTLISATTGDFSGQVNANLIQAVSINMMGATGTIKIANMTGLQIGALTPEEGMLVYNTTTSKIQGYAGGSWVDLH